MVSNAKKMLTKHYNIKDKGMADVILEIKISRTIEGNVLSQYYYVEKIFKKFEVLEESSTKILLTQVYTRSK